MNFVRATFAILIVFSLLIASRTRSVSAEFPGLQSVTWETFEDLLESSPFTRPLNLSGALVLTGVAEVNGSPVATIIDTQNGASIAVTTTPDEHGWKLIDFSEGDDIEIGVATLATDGGDEIKVYYDEDRIREAIKKRDFANLSRSLVTAVRTGTYTLPRQIQQIEDLTRRGQAIAKLIEVGAFDESPFEAVDMALSQSHPQTRGPILSAAFGLLGGGVGGVEYQAAVTRLNSLNKGRDRDFAINGLAHGLVGKDPDTALEWANSISNEGFRNIVVKNVTRRIEGR